MLKPTSRFREAADVWYAKASERREDSTADTYRRWLDKLVLPQLGELRIHEYDAAANTRSTIRAVDVTLRDLRGVPLPG
jgi:hypothetical protein